MHDFSEQLREYKYNPRYVMSDMGRRGEERRTLLYFDLTIFTRDIRRKMVRI